MSKENDIIRYLFIYSSETSTQDQDDRLYLTKNIIDLKDSSKATANKQPRVIFEKPEKQLKSKVIANEYIFNLGTSKDKIMKYSMHKKKHSLDTNELFRNNDNRLERVTDESNISSNKSNMSSKLLYTKQDKKLETKPKSLKTTQVKKTNSFGKDSKEEKKEKLRLMQKKKELSNKISKDVLENNYIKAKPQQKTISSTKPHNKRSKSSDIKSTSSIKRTNEEENEELMYNLRSTSSDKHTNTMKFDANIISIKQDNTNRNEKKKTKREKAMEYNKKTIIENNEKMKKNTMNRNSYPKENSKESEYEDRPKRTPMNNFITSEKNQLSNISEKNLCSNSNYNSNQNPNLIKTNNFFLKDAGKIDQKTKKKPKQEIYDINHNRLKLIESNNVMAIIEAERKNEKEKTRELGKMQHKINYLTKYNRIEALSHALANQLEEGENNDIKMEEIDQIEGLEEIYANEQFEKDSKNLTSKKDDMDMQLNDSMEEQEIEQKNKESLKNPANASNQTYNFKSSYLKGTSRSKSTPSIKVRKPKVDSLDFLRKIKGNNNFGLKNQESNTFRKSYSKDSNKKNYSKSVKNNSQDQISEVKVDYKTTHLIDNNNFVMAYKEKRSEEQSQQLQRIIMYQKEKRRLEKERIKEEEEEKNKKILANLIKLTMDQRSKSMSRFINKSGSYNSNSNIIVGKNGKKYVRNRSSPKLSNNNNNFEESSYLDNDVYLQQIREFINNDLPREKQFAPNYIKNQPSIKNLQGSTNNNNNRQSSKTANSFDKNDNRSEKNNTNNNFHNLKSITEISEKNNRITENTPKNYIISPKDNLQGFEFSNYGINSIKTPNSEEIDKKMNFFESGDHSNKQKIQTLKSLESDLLSEKNLNEFSNQFNRDNRMIDEKAKLTELRNQTNIFKEKFKNLQNAGNIATNTNNPSKQNSNRSNESFPKNNIDPIDKINLKNKKTIGNNSISFKQNIASQSGGEMNSGHVISSKHNDLAEEEAAMNRIMEIAMNNAAIKIQNFYRYIKYLREHYEEFQDQEMYDGSNANYNESEDMDGYSNYKHGNHDQHYLNSEGEIDESNVEQIEISDHFPKQSLSNSNRYIDKFNNSYDAKGRVSKLNYSYDKNNEENILTEEKQFEISSKSVNKNSEKSDRNNSQLPASVNNNKEYSDSRNNSRNYEPNLSNPVSGKKINISLNNSHRENLNNSSNKLGYLSNYAENKSNPDSSRKNEKSLNNSLKEINSLGSKQASNPVVLNRDGNSAISNVENKVKNQENEKKYQQNVNVSANSSFRSDYSRKCYSVQQNRNNSTIILSPNSVDSPRLHNIIAIRNLIDRQRSEKSMSQSGSEHRQPTHSSHNYSQDFNDIQNFEENEINNTSDFKNLNNNENDSKNDISIRSNNSTGKINLKPKDGAPKLNLLDLGKKKSNRSNKSETSEQFNLSVHSSDKNFDVINYENSLKNTGNNNNNSLATNVFKSGKNFKSSPKEVHSNNNILLSSKDPIDINNKNNLISSQESSLSRKDNRNINNDSINESPHKNQLSHTQEKLTDEKENLGSSIKSNVSVKVFDNKLDANNNPVLQNNNLNSSKFKDDAVSENSKNNNSFESKYTFKKDYTKNNRDKEERSIHNSFDSKNQQDHSESSITNKNAHDNSSKQLHIVEKGFIVDIPMPIVEEKKPTFESQSSSHNIRNTDEMLDEEIQLKGSGRSYKPDSTLNSKRLQKFDSLKNEMNSEIDLEAEIDNKEHIDWQMTLITDKTFDKDNNQLSSRSDKNYFKKKEEKQEEDGKESLQHKTKEIKENQDANHNNSYDDFVDDENLGSIDDNYNDNSNITDILKDKFEDENKKDKTPIDSKSEREEIFFKSKADSQESIKMDNLLDDIKSNSDFNSLSPHIIPTDKDKSTSAINARYQEYVESERKSQNQTDRFTTGRVERKESEIPVLSAEDIKIGEDLTEILLKELINKEFERLIPKKKNIIVVNNNTSLSYSHISNPGESSRDSSIFMKSVLEEKKEIRNNYYTNQIGPHLIKNVISQEITRNYNNITKNLSKPYINKPADVLVSLLFRDKDKIRNSYKLDPEPLTNVFNKKTVMSKMEPEIEKLRYNDKELIPYDKILNECLIDAALENLNEERVYGSLGEPFPWSNRTRTIKYKYAKTEGCKNSLIRKIDKNLNELMKTKIGLIPENNEVESELINYEREKRLISSITNTLNDEEEQWKNYELEETQVKIELSEMVLEQLLNELVEIFEHVHLSRKHPKLYQYKSIYGCEDIPRLSFQYGNMNDGDDINQ